MCFSWPLLHDKIPKPRSSKQFKSKISASIFKKLAKEEGMEGINGVGKNEVKEVAKRRK